MKATSRTTSTFLTKFFISAICALGFLVSIQIAEAATLTLSPNTGVYTIGQTFTAQVRVNTAGQAINAAEGTLSFDTGKLSVVGVSKGSIFSLWAVDPTFSNSAGTVTFGGGSPSGYTGSGGTVISVTFRTKAAGTAKVTFSSGSVLAADGRGTNVLTSMNSGSYTIAAAEVPAAPEVIEYVAPANTPAAPVVESTTHPSEDWSKETTAELSWAVPGDVTAVRTLLSSSPNSVPTKVYESPISSLTIDELEAGEQYFHIQFKNADGWGRVTHYRLAVDNEGPVAFSISLPEGADLSNPVQTLELHASDTLSGITRYEVQLNGGEPFEFIDESASGTLALPSLEPGKHTVIIEAFDAAGNSKVATFSFTILAFDKPSFTEYPTELNAGVIPVIQGVTRPGSVVTILLTKVTTGEVVTYETVSDDNGNFTFIASEPFKVGVYEITAQAVDAHGAASEPSDTVRVLVREPGYITVGSFVLSVLSVLVPLIAMVLLLVLIVLFFIARLKRLRTGVVREADEAITILERQFKKLRQELVTGEKSLAASRRTKKLTKAEAALIDEVRQSLDKAEIQIKKEIEDVDKLVE